MGDATAASGGTLFCARPSGHQRPTTFDRKPDTIHPVVPVVRPVRSGSMSHGPVRRHGWPLAPLLAQLRDTPAARAEPGTSTPIVDLLDTAPDETLAAELRRVAEVA